MRTPAGCWSSRRAEPLWPALHARRGRRRSACARGAAGHRDRSRPASAVEQLMTADGRARLSAAGRRAAGSRSTMRSRFAGLLLWRVPAGLLVLAVAAGRWMAGRALAPLARLAATRTPSTSPTCSDLLAVRGAATSSTRWRRHSTGRSVGWNRRRRDAAVQRRAGSRAADASGRSRGEAELALMQRAPGVRASATLASQLEEFDRLTRLVNQLLTLARAEAGRSRSAPAGDLEALVPCRLPTSSIRWPASGASGGRVGPRVRRVTGDAGWLERLS